jgi:hypothetical protein
MAVARSAFSAAKCHNDPAAVPQHDAIAEQKNNAL